MEDREGQRSQSRAGRSRSGAGPKGWSSSKKVVTENALGKMAAPDVGEKNVSQGGESALRCYMDNEVRGCGRVRLGLKKGALQAMRRMKSKK